MNVFKNTRGGYLGFDLADFGEVTSLSCMLEKVFPFLAGGAKDTGWGWSATVDQAVSHQQHANPLFSHGFPCGFRHFSPPLRGGIVARYPVKTLLMRTICAIF